MSQMSCARRYPPHRGSVSSVRNARRLNLGSLFAWVRWPHARRRRAV